MLPAARYAPARRESRLRLRPRDVSGVPEDLCHSWAAEDFDWRAAEQRLNTWNHYRTVVDGERRVEVDLHLRRRGTAAASGWDLRRRVVVTRLRPTWQGDGPDQPEAMPRDG